MITEAKFKLALKEMMKTKPLEEINVTALCKKCDVHRQTFYYHYQDIYDLIAAIFLNENFVGASEAKNINGLLKVFTTYIGENFAFLRSTFNSAARDLTEDFIFGKLNAALFDFWTKNKIPGLKKASTRDVARRFAHFITDEFGYCFKNPKLTAKSFQSSMDVFLARAVEVVLPAIIELANKEEVKA